MRLKKRIDITLTSDELDQLNALAKEFNMNRSRFVGWLVYTTSAFLSAPSLNPNKEFVDILESQGFMEMKGKTFMEVKKKKVKKKK